jgi:ligand-binding sensor domain-containing protein
MTRILKNLYYLIILLNTFTYLYSGTRFEHITVKDGLSHNHVTRILKDSKGFMWFCTIDGLSRYDGKNFKVYKHDPEDSNSLSNNHVQAIYEDKNGNLWIGTYGGGLNKFELLYMKINPDIYGLELIMVALTNLIEKRTYGLVIRMIQIIPIV